MLNSDIKAASAEELFRKVYTIRYFEHRMETLFREGRLIGTAHACIGQEAIPVGIMECIKDGDYIISNHRGHGHYLAYTQDYAGLFAELMGKPLGVVGGRGGSQHLHRNRFFSNGVQGGMCPFAVGAAFFIKKEKADNIVICFLGDGTFGQGVLYESLNLASLWGVPVLFIVENNQYAMSTHVDSAISGTFEGKAAAFNIKSQRLKTGDIFEIIRRSSEAVSYCRHEKKPFMLIFDTYRFCGHSKSDDCCYRDTHEESEWKALDPVELLEKVLGEEKAGHIKAAAHVEVDAACLSAINSH